MKLVERHIIKRGHKFFDECDSLCLASKNLYNLANYNIRQGFIYAMTYSNYNLLDSDPIPVYGDDNAKLIKFSGKRIKRGLYRSSTGKSINADVNASYNILRKVFPKAFADGIEGCVVQPRLVTPTKEKIKGYNDSIFHEEPFYTTSYCEVTKFKTKKGS
ncbi:MAG: hypothetical protein QNJ54_37260, partial [Prochloraceae cyanobacterium]|nr:hypothetical protein [Prochloraceae cyanobacterium]